MSLAQNPALAEILDKARQVKPKTEAAPIQEGSELTIFWQTQERLTLGILFWFLGGAQDLTRCKA